MLAPILISAGRHPWHRPTIGSHRWGHVGNLAALAFFPAIARGPYRCDPGSESALPRAAGFVTRDCADRAGRLELLLLSPNGLCYNWELEMIRRREFSPARLGMGTAERTFSNLPADHRRAWSQRVDLEQDKRCVKLACKPPSGCDQTASKRRDIKALGGAGVSSARGCG